MANISKYYKEILETNKVSCDALLHPGMNCEKFFQKNIPLMVLGTAKFFFPLYFVS